MENKIYRTLGFGEEVKCFFKDLNGGVYDVYVCGKCIVRGINKSELEIMVKILKLE